MSPVPNRKEKSAAQGAGHSDAPEARDEQSSAATTQLCFPPPADMGKRCSFLLLVQKKGTKENDP